MPKVSVIIPVYGVEKYIERCARSLFEQTLMDMEFIFVDDCTPDRSIEILRQLCDEYRLRFAEEKKSVRIVKMPSNSGQSAVRRHGVQLASGDYIVHCDSDDWVDITMYEKMYMLAITSGYDVVVSDFYRTDGVSYRNKSCTIPEKVYADKMLLISKMLVGSDLTSLCTKIVSRHIYSKVVFPDFNMQEDAYVSLQIFFFSQKVGHVSECLYHYYYNPLSISRHPSVESYLERLHQVCENTNGMIAFAKDNGFYETMCESFDCQKLRARNHIVPLTKNRYYYKLWRNTYPEIDKTILTNSIVDRKERRQYCLIRINLYHLLCKILILLNLRKETL